MADSARPGTKPVFPNTRMNALFALLLATVLSCGAAVLADSLDNTIRDPEQIQKGLKTEVLGALPVVKGWRGHIPSLLAPQETASGQLIKAAGPRNSRAAAYEEAIRTLRDSILLSDVGRRPKSLLFTSATPREGKTTTSTHLAIAHSLQKRKTLLIDADLRRPGVHVRLGLLNEVGLRNAITDGRAWRELIQKPEGYPDLDVITAGPASTRAADRVGGVLEKILMDAESEYDLVIVDSPPLLGFAEPLQMANVVDGVVIITLAGQTNRNAVASVVNSLKRLKANVIGVALNEVREDMSDRYYYYGYYGSYYSRYYKPTNA